MNSDNFCQFQVHNITVQIRSLSSPDLRILFSSTECVASFKFPSTLFLFIPYNNVDETRYLVDCTNSSSAILIVAIAHVGIPNDLGVPSIPPA